MTVPASVVFDPVSPVSDQSVSSSPFRVRQTARASEPGTSEPAMLNTHGPMVEQPVSRSW